jgi:Reverse transcriptase (RNA-dependent DNA polymerase)
MPPQDSPPLVSIDTQDSTRKLLRVKFDRSQSKAYSAAVRVNTPELMHEVADAPTTQLACLALEQHIIDAACGVFKHKHITPCSHKGKSPSGNAPWFDAECQHLYQQYCRLCEANVCDSFSLQMVRQAYRRVFRRKKRLHHARVVQELVDAFRHDPHKAFQTLAPRVAVSCAVPVSSMVEHYTTLLGSTGPEVAVSTFRKDLSTTAAFQHANELNLPFSDAEILVGIKRLKNHKAYTGEGLRSELIKYAVIQLPDGSESHLLAPVIRVLFDRILTTGEWPRTWDESFLHSIYKKGDKSNPGNYRGIAVEPTLVKLFASVLDTRLQDWAEKYMARAPGQAGFRRKMGTTDQIFILMHLVQRYRWARKPLFCCFVDFQKAFDSVRRDMLFARLQQLGVGDPFLRVLQNMYASVLFRLVTEEGLSSVIASLMGVKQGSPASPTLFGLFLDELEEYFEHFLPGVGVALADVIVALLLYADDLVLLAESATDLQRQLDVLQKFCGERGLVVNVAKTEVVVFATDEHTWNGYVDGLSITYGAQTLQVSSQFTYLGCVLHAFEGWQHMLQGRLEKATVAMNLLDHRCQVLGFHDVATKLRLFNVYVRSVLTSACEIWGVDMLFHRDRRLGLWQLTHDVDKLFIGFLRRMLRVSPTTSAIVVLHECLSVPCIMFVWNCVVRFWDRMVGLPDCSLLKKAFVANCALVVQAGRRCWVGAVLHGLNIFHGISVWDGVSPLSATRMPSLGSQLSDFFGDCIARFRCLTGEEVLARPSNEITLATYFTYFFAGYDRATLPLYLGRLDFGSGLAHMARFRCGCHRLAIHLGRQGRHSVPRDQRLCRFCGGHVEDELHVVLHCPVLHQIRVAMPELFGVSGSSDDMCLMRWLFSEAPPKRVVHFFRMVAIGFSVTLV